MKTTWEIIQQKEKRRKETIEALIIVPIIATLAIITIFICLPKVETTNVKLREINPKISFNAAELSEKQIEEIQFDK